MKRPLTFLFVFAPLLCAPADCPTTQCDQDDNGQWTIQQIADCPADAPCTRKEGHHFDPELDERKNIWRDDHQQPLLVDTRWIRSLRNPTKLKECGSRDELKQLGEGQKITIVAWALTAKSGSPESANCDLPHQVNQDNHIVLIPM